MSSEHLPAVPIDDSSRQDRQIALERLSRQPLDVELLKKSVRNECHGSWIKKSSQVWECKSYDAACLYFWNRAMADLRTKIIAYGKEHLEAIIGREIKDERHLINILDDKNLIDHTYELGIISEEAWFFLQKSREVRNHYTLAHEFNSELDPLEALNIIKNCVKYILAEQVPSPGINLKNVLEKLKNEEVKPFLKEIEATYREQSIKIVNITLNRIFDDFIKEKSNNTYINNILEFAPILWNLSDSSVKQRIGKLVAKLRAEADSATTEMAMAFMSKVDGFKYIPESIRVAIFSGAAERLLEACQGANNFYNEVDPAKKMCVLGTEIPSSAVNICTKVALLSYVGNQFGHSRGARPYCKKLIDNWTSSNISALVDILETDLTVLGRLDNNLTAGKLKEILELISNTPRDDKTAERIEFYKNLENKELATHFRNKYFKRFK
jgi:hypothetical protein